MENPHRVTWPSKQNTNATVAMECYHMRYDGYGGDTATWKQWIVGVKLRSGQLFADDVLTQSMGKTLGVRESFLHEHVVEYWSDCSSIGSSIRTGKISQQDNILQTSANPGL
jgi:hypothetical protein